VVGAESPGLWGPGMDGVQQARRLEIGKEV
jgi:hypothetical protein